MSGAPPAVGIDLGTTHSAIATASADGRARILGDAQGARSCPSAVSFPSSGGVLVGPEARARRLIDPKNTILGAKRLLGLRYGSAEVADMARVLPNAFERGENDQVAIATRAGSMIVPEIVALVLDYLRDLAARDLGSPVSRAVIAVPANFHDGKRAATLTAGAIAGIEVPFLINEPTAAAIAYGARRELDRIIAVYDFGGGTFDVSILELRGRVYEVLATAGDPFLGGDDIDSRIVTAMADAFLERQRIDLREDPTALSRLREAAESLKAELSWRHRAACRLDAIAYGRGGVPLQLAHEMTRDDLVRLSSDLIERTFPVCDEALRRAGLRAEDIGDVALVGGTTRIPHVRQRVAQHFGRAARTDIDPDGAVALGAALQAAALAERAGTSVDEAAPTIERPPHAARGDSEEGDTLERPVPTRRDSTEGDTLERPAHPDRRDSTEGDTLERPGRASSRGPDRSDTLEATEISGSIEEEASFDQRMTDPFTAVRDPRRGERSTDPSGAPPAESFAAGQNAEATAFHSPPPLPPSPPEAPPQRAGAPASAEEQFVPPAGVFDVTSHSLALVTVAGFCEPIIARNTRVPAARTRVFTTAREHQKSVQIQICQGESRRAADNVFLGNLELSGMAPRPRSEASIEVTFSIDQSGLLRVTARDPQGREQNVELRLAGAPSRAGVQRARERLSSLREDVSGQPPSS